MIIFKREPVPSAMNDDVDHGLCFNGADEKQGEAKSKSPFSVWKAWD
jgi:hypothetical protein